MVLTKYSLRFTVTLFVFLSIKCQAPEATINPDLNELTIANLHKLYATGKYTVTEVTQWHLDRIARYDSVFKAILYVDKKGALATASALDSAAAKGGKEFRRGPLWGVPIVIKANMSVKGWITSAGWKGY